MHKAIGRNSHFFSAFGKLRRKMFFSIVGILAFVLALIFSVLNIYFFRKEYNQSLELLSELLINGGHRRIMKDVPLALRTPEFEVHKPERLDRTPPFVTPDFDKRIGRDFDRPDEHRKLTQIFFPRTFDVLDYFTIKTDGDGNICEVISDYPLRNKKNLYTALVKASFYNYHKTKNIDGFENGIRWKMTTDKGGFLIACIDRRSAWELYSVIIWACIICFLVFVGFASVFAWFFSGFAIRPIKKMFAEQKQFIADAGHELKTPIAVIGANVDVLLGESPENKWLHYIQAENNRLSVLVKELLYLAQNDADRMKIVMRHFNFSDMVETVVLPFESMIYEQKKTLILNVENNIFINGDENQLKEVAIVLIDNAIKNTEADAEIKVTVYRQGNNCILKVFNTGRGIPHEELNKIFLRFYRADTSRARNTGGYGLGLAIAKTIVLQHQGCIKADSEVGKWAEFSVKLPVNAAIEKTSSA